MSEAAKFAKSVPTRTESDSMGKIEVPMDRYYGAQTARSLIHFDIGKDTMAPELIRAFGGKSGFETAVHEMQSALYEVA